MRWATLLAATVCAVASTTAHAQDPPYPVLALEDRAAAEGRGIDQSTHPEWLARTAPQAASYLESGDAAVLHDPYRADWNGTRGEILPVTFTNRYGARLVGRMYRPKGAAGPLPAVVAVPGFSFQSAESSPGYAYEPILEQIAEAGYVVFEFEPQGQGGSELDPSPKAQFCGEQPGAAWREPQEVGLEEHGECAGYDDPAIERPGTPTADVLYDAMGPLAATPLGAALTPAVLLDVQIQRLSNDPELLNDVAGGYELFRTRFVFGALDAVGWLTSDANPWRDAIDPARLGIVGHSAGADGALIAGNGDPQRRFKAVVAWDGYGDPPAAMPARVPTMLQQSELQNLLGPWLPQPDPELWLSYRTADRFRAAGVPTGVVALRGSTHQEWDYIPYQLANPIAPLTNSSSLGGQVAAYYTVAWLDRYLKGSTRGERRLFARRFDGSTDASSIGTGTYDPATQSNRPYKIRGRKPADLLSRIFHSRLSGAGRSCPDLRAGCP